MKRCRMDFREVVRTRRSVRSYGSRAVTAEVLGRVLEAARLAPSANNVQPWRYVVIRDAGKIREIARLAAGQMFIAEAPVVVVLCARSYVDRYSWIGGNMYLVDATISMDHLVLAARSEGLGTCWIGAFDRNGIEKLLNIPSGVHPLMITPLGYPRDDSAFSDAAYRRPLNEICFSEEYGNEMAL